jgi:ATP-dependent DNA helicase RecG
MKTVAQRIIPMLLLNLELAVGAQCPGTLISMRLLNNGLLSVSGALLFAADPTPLVPAFHIKAVCYPGTDIHASQYADSADIYGRIDSQFEQAMSFILRNLRREQRHQGVNSEGILEVPRIVFEELLANAIIHRDFFISAPIRIFMFEDRIEIISPGHLPNNLTVANIRSGNSNMRNPILASYATKVLPYRGLGNGIVRAIKEYPEIELIDDREGNRFVAIVRRSAASERA